MILPPNAEPPQNRVLGLFHGDGLVAPPRNCSEIGTLLPIAPCGRTSLSYLRQASSFFHASASVRNQCVFGHSAQKRPLNASMSALSVGR